MGSIALGGLIGVTVLGWFTSLYGWPLYLEIFSHFQVQYLILSLGLLGIVAFTQQKAMVLIGLLCCALLAVQVLSWYTPPAVFASAQTANLRVFAANVNIQNKRYEQVLAIARQASPDLAIFMEVDNDWIAQLNTLRDVLPYSSADLDFPKPGLVVYSRTALINLRLEYFATKKRVSVVAELEVEDANSRRISVVATHPLPPINPALFHSRNRQLDQAASYIQTIEQPTLLVGDLNITMWSPYYKQMADKAGLINARKGFGIIPTWPRTGIYQSIPSFIHFLSSIPIDHCLHSREIRTVKIHTGEATGSDHAPIIVDLWIPTGRNRPRNLTKPYGSEANDSARVGT
ncbi:MAG: endonuclease/exonuclease/phosphatase family protein [Synechococcales bacterium]|nr:endonuclease/exonuclease/phosphatase family protein [Synechococcales bacterium]